MRPPADDHGRSKGDRNMPEMTRQSLSAFARRERDRYEELLRDFVEVPTVSVQPEHRDDIRRGVDLAVATIREFGGKAEVVKSDGNPLVWGTFGDRKAPSVTVYNHLDVQPASRESEPWDTEPFTLVKDGDRYYGRGTTDDKGPALSALFAIRAAVEAGVPMNMRVLWEFEEEIGSPSFEKAIAGAGTKLETDSVIVSDTIWISRNQPACPAGLRGLVGFTLTLQTAENDHHSGTTGGAARNSLGELMKLVSEMYDAKSGKVKIPGFYDDVAPLTKEELDEFRRAGFSVKTFKKDNRLRSLRSDNPLEVMKRLWALPTMEVHGVVGGYTGTGVKTIIPPKAEVKMSCRIVPEQDPKRIAKLVRDFVKAKHPEVKVEIAANMYPFKAPVTGPYADAVRDAMEFAFKRPPVFVREGGSIGAVVSMEKVFRCPVMFLGLSLPEHGYHAPNENFDWRQASGGIAALARYFENLSKMPREAAPARRRSK
jgi:acetylornithine deacetylase/succinyl-diaminopimelate desuccinylase-like protein